MSRRNSVLFATATVVIAATLILIGCGGGGSTITNPPPATIAASFTTSLPGTVTASSCSTAMSWPVAASGNPAPTITVAVTSGSGTVTYSGGQVTFTPVCNDAQQSVKVTATATNIAGSDTTSVTVTVPAQPVAPAFTTRLPAMATVNCGSQASWPVAASGTPAPTITTTLTGAGSASFANGNVIYIAPTCSATAASATVNATANNSAGHVATEVAITVPAAIAPSMSLSCPQSSVLVNSSMDCTLTVGGVPAPTVTVSAVHGTTAISGTTLHYTSPAAANPDTITATASNGVGSPAVATWNLQVIADLKPSFSGASLASGFCDFWCGFGGIELAGLNFSATDSFTVTPTIQQGGWNYISPTKLTFTFAVDRMYWDPGRIDIVDTNTYGSSNVLHLAHRSSRNMLDCSPASSTNECYLLDSINNVVRVFNRSTGVEVRRISVMTNFGLQNDGQLGYQGLNYDDVNKVIVLHNMRYVGMYKADGSGSNLFFGAGWWAPLSSEVATQGGAASYGFGCFSDTEQTTGQLGCFSTHTDSSHPTIQPSDMIYLPVVLGSGSTAPMSVSIAKVGDQVVVNTFDVLQNQLASFNLPQGTKRYQATVSGLTQFNSYPAGAGGIWDIALSNGGVVLVSSPDKVVVVYDQNGSEIKRVTLAGTAVMATLDSSGDVIVAEYDNPVTGITKFEKVNPVTGDISLSSATVSSFFPTGLSFDTAGNRSNFYKGLVY